jgi:chromosome partitioning protein
MVDIPGRELRLRQALETVRGRYDFILIDTPPSLSMLTVNALTAADAVLIPHPV